MSADRMTPLELRVGLSLAGVYALRMLGLFIVLPVFALHAEHIEGGDDLALVGVALGAYGLAQGVLQIPFGMASDRWGRKPVLYAGLLIFAAGSFLGMAADDIWMSIVARALQGAGAVSSVAMALAADLTREQHRTKIMAIIGSMIGLMFAVSLVGAPILYRWIGMEGIFGVTGLLALGAVAVVRVFVPVPPAPKRPAAGGGGLRRVLLDAELLRLNAGILVLHVVLYAMFVVLPGVFVATGLELAGHWKLYVPVLVASFVLMVPAVIHADRRQATKSVLIGSVAALAATEAALGAVAPSFVTLAVVLGIFFTAFNVLEALLPSLVSRRAPAEGRGVAIGVYNTTQTLGVFFGGVLGGWVARDFGAAAVFYACAALCAAWLLAAAGMRPPPARRPVNDPGAAALSGTGAQPGREPGA